MRARRRAIALDYDGTLAPLVRRPHLSRVPATAREALAALTRLPGTKVAVLSGRGIEDLGRRLRLPRAFLAGSAGLETRFAGARVRSHVPPRKALPPELRAAVAAWSRRFPGAWLERKRHSLALHDRAVPARLRPALHAGLRRRLAPWVGRFTLVRGKLVVEIAPAVRRDKGAALATWLGRASRTGLLYVGDDRNDEPALAWTRAHGGIAVVVGRMRPGAQVRAAGPAEVARFLVWLAAALKPGQRPATRAPSAPDRPRRAPAGGRPRGARSRGSRA
jgi:trehalose-phosphatase